MAIKRLTIELDDSSDTQKPTASPSKGAVQEFTEAKRKGLTGITEDVTDESTESTQGISSPQITGRTFPDLITEFISNPRAMATMLMFIPFVIFAAKINTIEAIKFPFITGVILNTVWFVTPLFIAVVRWLQALFIK